MIGETSEADGSQLRLLSHYFPRGNQLESGNKEPARLHPQDCEAYQQAQCLHRIIVCTRLPQQDLSYSQKRGMCVHPARLFFDCAGGKPILFVAFVASGPLFQLLIEARETVSRSLCCELRRQQHMLDFLLQAPGILLEAQFALCSLGDLGDENVNVCEGSCCSPAHLVAISPIDT